LILVKAVVKVTAFLSPGRWLMSPQTRLQRLGRFGLRALRIAASTLSVVELLRSDWVGGVTSALAWFVFIQVERRLQDDAESTD